MYDIFFIGDSSNKQYKKLKKRFITAKCTDSVQAAKQKSLTSFLWIVYDDIEVNPDFDFDYKVDEYSKEYTHVFQNGDFYDGVVLMPKNGYHSPGEIKARFFVNKKIVEQQASSPIKTEYDIVFISYNEPNADENYSALCKRYPNAKRVHSVKGIHQAHIAAAKLATTELFFVVDGDAEIIDNFNFDYYVPAYDPTGKQSVHVWKSQNPINGLIYGYGGVKLLPRELTLNMDTTTADMTTSISKYFKAVNKISNVTKFDTDEFSAWRSAFRECVKLSSRTIKGQLDEETEFRLTAWCTRGKDKPFGSAAIAGAKHGKNYGETNKNNLEALTKINDFDWLRNEFNNLKDSF